MLFPEPSYSPRAIELSIAQKLLRSTVPFNNIPHFLVGLCNDKLLFAFFRPRLDTKKLANKR